MDKSLPPRSHWRYSPAHRSHKAAASKNVELIVPSAPAAATTRPRGPSRKVIHDRRLMSASLSVNNKPGGGGNIALAYLNQHAGDAHYVFVATPSILTNRSSAAARRATRLHADRAVVFEYIVFARQARFALKTQGPRRASAQDTQSVSVAFATALGITITSPRAAGARGRRRREAHARRGVQKAHQKPSRP